ncbi:fimbrial protein [Ralstonia sp. 1138]|uniref:fimbrial protein n=1 Tax=Ralstonia sp. 1138 TaxID=3156423 RepID=UPI003396FDFC
MRTSGQRFVAKLAFHAMLVLACVLESQSALAMRCVASGGADKFVEPIGSVQTYPVNAPDGYIIWISPTRTTTGYCYKDLRPGVSWEDPVFFYANPANMDPAAWGLEIGIRYKGVDHFGASNQVGTGVPTGDIVPVCTTADFDAGLCPKVPVSITYQVVVRKRGTWTGVPQDTYPVFQFDGARGLNCCNTSFQYILSGLENLKPTPCIVDVSVAPEPGIVDFGQVQATPTGFSPTAPTRPFSLALTKQQCTTSVKINGYFQTSNPLHDGLVLPSADSNFGISIQDRTGKVLPIGEPFSLATFSPSDTYIDVPMTATLKPLGAPKIGPFTAVVTVQILYD